jgi:hypothetical protein
MYDERRLQYINQLCFQRTQPDLFPIVALWKMGHGLLNKLPQSISLLHKLPSVFLDSHRTFLLQVDALVRAGCILRKQAAVERPVCAENGSGVSLQLMQEIVASIFSWR